MKKLISLPEHLAGCFHEIEGKDRSEWFCASDPKEKKIGSGGATARLLSEYRRIRNETEALDQWLGREKRILIHGGGRSRRLPAYAPTGKMLTPLPVFRWERGQKIDQNLMELQMPLCEKILSKTPQNINTLIAAGDVHIHFSGVIDQIPEADVACCGLWADPSIAGSHGVFICDGAQPERMLCMLQKPDREQLQALGRNHLYLMDIGIWLLSDRAVELLMARCGYGSDDRDGSVIPESLVYYDLYSQFGLGLGEQPTSPDESLGNLKAAVLPLSGGEFYHYGTSRDLISSTLSIQNRVLDQRSILHKHIKPHSSMFVQNSETRVKLNSTHENLWVENSYIGSRWQLSGDHVITGIPDNDWDISLKSGLCLDIVPVDERSYCLRPYGMSDSFDGEEAVSEAVWMEAPLNEWFDKRDIPITEIVTSESMDIQSFRLFPVVHENDLSMELIEWMLYGKENPEARRKWLESERLSADQIQHRANPHRLYRQREKLRNSNLEALLRNHTKSVFFQVDLDQLSRKFAEEKLSLATKLPDTESALNRMQEQMFLARVKQYKGESFAAEEANAFGILRESVVDSVKKKRPVPKISTYPKKG